MHAGLANQPPNETWVPSPVNRPIWPPGEPRGRRRHRRQPARRRPARRPRHPHHPLRRHRRRPAVIVFYRGAWCPYCNLALSAYQAQLLPVLTERERGA